MKRIDVILTERSLAKSRTNACTLIKEGRVKVNGRSVIKPSELFDEEANIDIQYPDVSFVSRGGLKLEEAINAFGVDANGRTCIDIGASTGGFTDCLLRHGAKKVYAVDSGTAQLDKMLKNDSRVVCMENTNARYLSRADFDNEITLCVMDVSFISQTLIYPAIADILPCGGEMVTLIKPQFELERSKLSKNGIVHDTNGKLFEQIEQKIKTVSADNGLKLIRIIPSPITGGDGNKEYLGYFKSVKK